MACVLAKVVTSLLVRTSCHVAFIVSFASLNCGALSDRMCIGKPYLEANLLKHGRNSSVLMLMSHSMCIAHVAKKTRKSCDPHLFYTCPVSYLKGTENIRSCRGKRMGRLHSLLWRRRHHWKAKCWSFVVTAPRQRVQITASSVEGLFDNKRLHSPPSLYHLHCTTLFLFILTIPVNRCWLTRTPGEPTMHVIRVLRCQRCLMTWRCRQNVSVQLAPKVLSAELVFALPLSWGHDMHSHSCKILVP